MVKLIPNWKQAHRFLSVIAAAAGGLAYTAVEVAQNVKALGVELPPAADKVVVAATIIGVIAGRVVQQPVKGPAE